MSTVSDSIRERFMRDGIPIRLGGIASNLARINSFSARSASESAVKSLINESKHFIEWIAADTEIETAAELVEIQIQLALWQCTWPKTWDDLDARARMAAKCGDWSQHILEKSGLLTPEESV